MSDIVERLNMIRGTQFTPIEDALVAEAAATITALRAEVERLRGMLLSLATAEAEYRLLHDLHGDGDMRTGRGWDWMRRKGDEARAALTQTKDTTDEG